MTSPLARSMVANGASAPVSATCSAAANQSSNDRSGYIQRHTRASSVTARRPASCAGAIGSSTTRSPSSRVSRPGQCASVIGDLHEEAVEQVPGVVGARTGLGVVLDRRAPDVLEDEPLDGAVVEVEVAQLGGADLGLPAHRLVAGDGAFAVGRDDREAVVLARDVDAPGLEPLD